MLWPKHKTPNTYHQRGVRESCESNAQRNGIGMVSAVLAPPVAMEWNGFVCVCVCVCATVNDETPAVTKEARGLRAWGASRVLQNQREKMFTMEGNLCLYMVVLRAVRLY